MEKGGGGSGRAAGGGREGQGKGGDGDGRGGGQKGSGNAREERPTFARRSRRPAAWLWTQPKPTEFPVRRWWILLRGTWDHGTGVVPESPVLFGCGGT